MNVLLDTCAILWLANESDRLSPVAGRALDDAGFAYVSPVSAWEIGLKSAQGRLEMPEPLETWWPRVLVTHQLSEFPLYGPEAIRATRLPLIHRDPSDWLLIAIAIEHQFTLLTPDPVIRQYPGVTTLW